MPHAARNKIMPRKSAIPSVGAVHESKHARRRSSHDALKDDSLVGLYLVVLDEDGAIQNLRRVRARVISELLLVEELDMFHEVSFLQMIPLSATGNWLLFDDRDHFVFWRDYRYNASRAEK
jgi:hypothetical protein